jgi:tagatose-1,6-bisphosphate aldolase non-catalytic subunit AgaZ/GatZ
MLCLSPISKHIVLAYVKTAKELNAPLYFNASLNQVDRDGGYTGWTPSSFKTHVLQVAGEHGFKGPIILQLDHGGPWLKDEHIARNYSYSQALDDFLKSLEAFIEAGFNVIHIDTTVDMENENGYADLDKAVGRTIDLILYSEELASKYGVRLEYEIGSDRWGYKPVELLNEFAGRTLSGLRARGFDTTRIVFGVADVGTVVKPGNIVDPVVLKKYSDLMLKHNLYLKIHSGDYLENTVELTKHNVGGLNIGPMFAHVMYSAVKDVIREKFEEKRALEFLHELNNLIAVSDKLSKYVGGKVSEVEEYKLGLASRYIWSSARAGDFLNKISANTGVNIEQYLISRLCDVIRKYIADLGLINLNTYIAD